MVTVPDADSSNAASLRLEHRNAHRANARDLPEAVPRVEHGRDWSIGNDAHLCAGLDTSRAQALRVHNKPHKPLIRVQFGSELTFSQRIREDLGLFVVSAGATHHL
jgi:hypothetical protein